jgi:hypothetical protein
MYIAGHHLQEHAGQLYFEDIVQQDHGGGSNVELVERSQLKAFMARIFIKFYGGHNHLVV